MHPVVFEIPGIDFPVRFFGLFIIDAFFLATIWVQWLYVRLRHPTGVTDRGAVRAMWAGLGVLVAGRVLWLALPLPWGFRLGGVLVTDLLTASFCRRRLARVFGEEETRDANVVFSLAFWLLIMGFLGARAFWIITTPSGRADFLDAPLHSLFAFWDGGIVYYGGLLTATAFGVIYVRAKRLSVLEMGDAVMMGVALSLFIGRWACFSAGCDYGRPTDMPWGLVYDRHPLSLIPDAAQGVVALHPTQLYMSLNGLVIFLVLAAVLPRRRFNGQILYLFLMLYAVGRSIVEEFRADVGRGIYDLGIAELSSSQIISIPVFLVALVLFLAGWLRSRP